MEVLSFNTISNLHPCLSCGACCASFRVSFYWREAEPKDHDQPVPEDLWSELTDNLRCMKGTEVKHHPKCIALKGVIGEKVSCTIYSNRSSTCRNFKASFEDGIKNEKCDYARAKHGLRPLERRDWYLFLQSQKND